jgi:hypothetical protein
MGEGPASLIALLLLHMLLEFGVPIGHFKIGQPRNVFGTLGTAAIRAIAVAVVFWPHSQNRALSCLIAAIVALNWALVTTYVPRYVKNPTISFILIQSTHIASLAAAWTIAEGLLSQVFGYALALGSARVLAILLAYVVVMRPASTFIAAVLNPWLCTIDNSGSLKSAGTLIGYLERVLILTFVLLKRWDAIGFLLAAKSILRFNDLKGDDQRSLSEYVLLGTLLSVAIAIAVGLMLFWTLESWTQPSNAATAGSSLKKLLSAL